MLDALKNIYYSFEDRYYAFLDKVAEKIPVYRVVDPIDSVVPSFLLVLLLIFLALLALGLILLSAGSGIEAKFVVVDGSGNPVGVAQVTITSGGETQQYVSDALGEFSARLKSREALVEAKKSGFEDYSSGLTVTPGAVNRIVLVKKQAALVERFIEIKDEGGNPYSGASIRYTCSDNVAPPPSKASASGEERILVPEGCGSLTAIVSAPGYEEERRLITVTRTVIILVPIGSHDERIAGTIMVSVVDSASGAGIAGIDLSLYDSFGVLQSQGQSDSSGVYVFTAQAGDYTVGAYDPSPGISYGPEQSGTITVIAGQATDAVLRLSRFSGAGKKVLLKFIDNASKNPVAGVSASLMDGNSALAQLVSGPDGLVMFQNVDGNKLYSVIAAHSDYLLRLRDRVKPLSATDSNATIIEMDKATLLNSGKVKVSVKSFEGTPIESAEVRLFSPGHSYPLLSGPINSESTITFGNLPAGQYYARAEAMGQEGASQAGALSAGGQLDLDIVLVLQSGFIEAIVVDSGNKPVPGAKVEFFDAVAGKIGEKTTKGDGKAEKAEFKWNLKPYLVVNKEGFLPHHSLAYSLVPNQATKVKVVMVKENEADVPGFNCDANSELCIGLVEILKSSGQAATSLAANSAYTFRFQLISGSDFNNVQAVVRAGLESQATAQDSLIVLRAVRTALASAVKYSGFDASDPYAEVGPTDGDAKQAKVSFRDARRGVYSFEADAFIKPDAAQDSRIEIRYGAKASKAGGSVVRVPEAGLILKSYALNSPLMCDPARADCQNFIFIATLTDNSSNAPVSVQLDSAATHAVVLDRRYDISLKIYNQHKQGKSFRSVPIKLLYNGAVLSVSPPQSSLPRIDLPNGLDRGTEIGLTLTPSGASLSAVLGIALDLNELDSNVSYSFRIPDRNRMSMSIAPRALSPGISSPIVVALRDSGSGRLVGGAVVEWASEANAATWARVPENAALGPGYYSAEIPGRGAGQSVWVRASKADYAQHAPVELPVGDGGITFEPVGFGCISIDTNRIEVRHNEFGVFTLTTSGCPGDVEAALMVPAASASEPAGLAGPISLTLENGSQISQYTDRVSLTLPKDGRVAVRAYGNKLLGQYDVYLRLRHKGVAEFTDANIVEVIVTPRSSSDFFRISKTSFDLFNGMDSGMVTNMSPLPESDYWYPKVGIDLDSGIKGYGLSQGKFDGLGKIEFTWTITGTVSRSRSEYMVLGANAPTLGNPKPVCAECAWVCSQRVGSPGSAPCTGSLTFNVDMANVTKAVLEQARFSDAASISINGQRVFSGGSGGRCTVPNSSDVADLNIEVQQYLVQGSNIISGYAEPSLNCGNYAYSGAKLRIYYSDNPAIGQPITETHSASIVPLAENTVFTLGSLSMANLEQLKYLDPTVDFVELVVSLRYANSLNNGSIEAWIEGTPDTNLVVKGRFVGLQAQNRQQPNGDFNLTNSHFTGRDYAIVQVDDYVSAQSLPDFREISFQYGITAASGQGTQTRQYNSSVVADGTEQEIGAISGFSQGSGTVYSLSESDEFAVVYFKTADGRPTQTATNPNAKIYARTAFSLIATKTVDLAILIDTSGSMDDEWQTVCGKKDSIVQQLRQQGLDVQFRVYGMERARTPCSDDIAAWGDSAVPLAATDSLDEAWAGTGQDVLKKFPWRQGSRRVMLTIGDNAPSGRANSYNRCSPYAEGRCYWTKGREEQLVQHLVDAAKGKNVSLFYFYPNQMETLVTDLLVNNQPQPGLVWDNNRNDAIELMEWAAGQTGGSAESYESSSGLGGQSNSRFVLVILKSTRPLMTQHFHVRVDSGKTGVCYGPNDVEGKTGPDAVPRLLTTWGWESIGLDACDVFRFDDTGAKKADFAYCDAAQFTTEIMKRLQRLREDVQRRDFSEVEKLLSFEAYLMRDGYSADFLSDFDNAAYMGFFSAPTSYTNSADGLNLLLKGNRVKFGPNAAPLQQSGLYTVKVSLKFGSAGQWVFFNGSQPNVDVNVVLSLRKPLDSGSLLYQIPVDGLVGTSVATPSTVDRVGYGTGFSGFTEDLASINLYKSLGGYTTTIRGSAGTPLSTLYLDSMTDFASVNHEMRGRILTIRKTGSGTYDFVLSPSAATPVAMEAVRYPGKTGVSSFVVLKDGSGNAVSGLGYLSSWSGFASGLASCTGFSGGRLFSRQQDTKISGAAATSLCSPTNENSFGFYWPNVAVSDPVYLRTVIYTPGTGYTLRNACENVGLALYSPSRIVNGNSPLELNYAPQVSSMAELFGLVNDKKVCTSSRLEGDTLVTDFWWNEKELYAGLESGLGGVYCRLPICGQIPESCTS